MSQTPLICEAREICASLPGVMDTARKQLLEGQLDNTSQVRAVVEGILRGFELAIKGVRLT